MDYQPSGGKDPEFARVAQAINSPVDGISLRVQYKAPARIPAGTCRIIYADGVTLNPGGLGTGLYVYFSGGAFAKL